MQADPSVSASLPFVGRMPSDTIRAADGAASLLIKGRWTNAAGRSKNLLKELER